MFFYSVRHAGWVNFFRLCALLSALSRSISATNSVFLKKNTAFIGLLLLCNKLSDCRSPLFCQLVGTSVSQLSRSGKAVRYVSLSLSITLSFRMLTCQLDLRCICVCCVNHAYDQYSGYIVWSDIEKGMSVTSILRQRLNSSQDCDFPNLTLREAFDRAICVCVCD